MPEENADTVVVDTFACRILTPSRTAFEGQVNRLEVKSSRGCFEILPRHEPLITPLAVGVMEITSPAGVEHYALHGGFLEMDGEDAVILANAVELADEIDLERARAAEERARERLAAVSGKAEDIQIDVSRVKLALLRALNRISVKGSK